MDKEIYGVIYSIRNKINNKIYIGQTISKGGFDRRYKHDLGGHTHNQYLKNSIKKYGIDNFEIDKEFDVGYSQEELNKLEDLYIKIYNTTNRKFGYNRRFGGGNNGKQTEEHKKHLSKVVKEKYKNGHIVWNKGKKFPQYSGENSPHYGKQRSEELKQNLSEQMQGRYNGEDNPFYGKTHTEEAKKKMSESKKKSCVEKGMTIKEMRMKLGKPRCKSVICLTTQKVFESMLEASEYYKVPNTNIVNCCSGRQKTAGQLEDGTKLVWIRYEDTLCMTKDDILEYIKSAYTSNRKPKEKKQKEEKKVVNRKGIPKSEETKAKMSASAKKLWEDNEERRKIQSNNAKLQHQLKKETA